jgi:hypothetical protein
MTNRLTAEQARLNVTKAPQTAVDEILETIKSVSESGRTEVKIQDYAFGFTKQPEERCTPLQLEIIATLRELGYTVGVKSEKSSCDSALVVAWG